MKLVHFDLNEPILEEKFKFTEWIIESPAAFTEYIQELGRQIAGEEEQFVLSENNKEMSLVKKADLIINPFAVDVNARKILNKLYSELSIISKEEQMYLKTMELFRHIQEYMMELEQCTDYILEYDQDLEISVVLKAVNVRYETKETDFLERLIQYIKIMAAVGVKLFIFVNLRSYLSDYQMKEIIKETQYQEVQCLFMENQQRSCIEGGKRCILDKDRCEI